MPELSVTIKTNWFGNAVGLNAVSSTDADKGAWRTRLDKLLNWVCGADRTSAVEALNVLKSAKTGGHQRTDGTIFGDRATLEAYLKLKSLVPGKYQPNFLEQLSSGELRVSIAGLDAGQPVSFAVPADDVRDVVWGQIAQQFDKSRKLLAYEAIKCLVSADTVTQQVCTCADLLAYAPPPDSALTWQIPAKGAPFFRLGTVDIPYCAAPAGHAADLLPEDIAHVLCSIRYDGECVITGFHDLAARYRQEESDVGVIEAELSFLKDAPQLVDALKLLRLHELNDDKGDYAFDLGREIEPIAIQMHEGDGDPKLFATRCGENAQRLMGCLERLEELAPKLPPYNALSRLA
ncbi:hypothetical protein [Pandoraea sputorum]|uniref:Uncharacterized protein n=1 Tax=Pandoraea sputorum TaxID=93222 RepID=A0A5E5BJP0_9BURK|nr:hypothetical protein [Pandoraea sputorum]VVE85924.1 hypothetical protein PSP31121_05557 [Pandoraea sputorum]